MPAKAKFRSLYERARWLLVFIGSSAFLFYAFILQNQFFDPRSVFRNMWYVCTDYLIHGVIYSGQPTCIEGMGFYSILVALQTAFGVEGLARATVMLTIFANAAIMVLLTMIVQRETGKWQGYSLAIIFLMLVSYRYGMNNPVIAWAVFWLVVGWYLQEYYANEQSSPRRYWYAGVAYMFAGLMHTTMFVPIAALLLLRCSPIERSVLSIRGMGIWLRDALKTVPRLILPLITSIALLTLWKPLYPIYTILLGTKNVIPFSLWSYAGNIIPAFFKLPWGAGGILTLFLLLQFLTIKHRYGKISILLSSLLLLNMGRIMEAEYLPRFFIPFYCLMIVATYCTFAKSSKRIRIAICTMMMIGVVVIAGELYREYERREFRNLIEAPWGFVEFGPGPVLTEDTPGIPNKQYLQSKRNDPFPPFEILNPVGLPTTWDDTQQQRFRLFGINNDTDSWDDRMMHEALNKQWKTQRRLLDKEYSSIVSVPPHFTELLAEAYTEEGTKGQNDTQIMKRAGYPYCTVPIPYLYYFGTDGIKFGMISYPRDELCEALFNRLEEYYRTYEGEICEGDQWLANYFFGVYTSRHSLPLGSWKSDPNPKFENIKCQSRNLHNMTVIREEEQ